MQFFFIWLLVYIKIYYINITKKNYFFNVEFKTNWYIYIFYVYNNKIVFSQYKIKKINSNTSTSTKNKKIVFFQYRIKKSFKFYYLQYM